jgi:hypothetical protein
MDIGIGLGLQGYRVAGLQGYRATGLVLWLGLRSVRVKVRTMVRARVGIGRCRVTGGGRAFIGGKFSILRNAVFCTSNVWPTENPFEVTWVQIGSG